MYGNRSKIARGALPLLLLFLFLSGKAQNAPKHWKEILAFKTSDSARFPLKGSILFVGSSSFRLWKNLDSSFAGYPVLNRGFGGATLVDLIRYTYDVVLPYEPKQVVIYCGENDFLEPDSVSGEAVALRFKTLYGMLRSNLPNAVISFVSIKPSPSRAYYQPRIRTANWLIQAFLKGQRKTQFINVYNAMLQPDGSMREDLFVSDRLHMNAKGYQIWEKVIRPYLLR